MQLQMNDFPINIPDPLPTRISPCPIIETVVEVRFVTEEDWSVLPGLLFHWIRDRFPKERSLPLSQVPAEFRRGITELTYKPLIEFQNNTLTVRLGPRVISLATKGVYPGWPVLRGEMEWLLDRVERAGFVTEGERLGLRYIDFFEGMGKLFNLLTVNVLFGDQQVSGPELNVVKVLRRLPFSARLSLNDGVTVRQGESVRKGGVFDLDVWLGPDDFDLFLNGMEQFDRAHDLNKEIFFGLLEPAHLSSLNPEYP